MIIEYISYIIPIFFLIALSILDIKTFNLKKGAIPAVLTTLFIIVSFLTSLNPVTAILSLLLGMLMVDLDVFGGVPDWKCIVACGMVLPNFFWVVIFGLLVTVFGTIFKFLVKRSNKWKEVPFIPVIAIAYVATLVGVILV